MKNSNQNNQATERSPQVAIKKHRTLFEKIKWRLNITKMIFSLLSMALYTVFVLVMLSKSWGNTVYMSIIGGFLAVYVILFGLILLISRKSSKHFNRSMKDYKSGLTILKSMLTLISFGLTVSIFAGAASFNIDSGVFQNAVLIISLVWAVFQIVYQVIRILKRHEVIKKRNKRRQ